MEAAHSRNAIVPYLCAKGAEAAIAYYKAVFGATEIDRYQEAPTDPIGHATLTMQGATLFISDEFPEIGVVSPITLGGTPVAIHITVPDVDAVTKHAVELGAKLLREPGDQPFGERVSKFIDPFGHAWMVATPI